MPALSQSDDTVDDQSSYVSVEGATSRMTLLSQPPDPKIPYLIKGEGNTTVQIVEGGGGEEEGNPLLAQPPAS